MIFMYCCELKNKLPSSQDSFLKMCSFIKTVDLVLLISVLWIAQDLSMAVGVLRKTRQARASPYKQKQIVGIRSGSFRTHPDCEPCAVRVSKSFLIGQANLLKGVVGNSYICSLTKDLKKG